MRVEHRAGLNCGLFKLRPDRGDWREH